jgi:hypothetical protein
MKEFDKIYLVWRSGVGSRRYAVGVLERYPDGKHTFKYLPEVKEIQEKEGFPLYTEFQDTSKIYNGNIAEIFGQRLTKLERSDAGTFLDFWEVERDKAQDKFYLLGKTQGLVATDNFEFLAEYKLIPETHFLTELASLTKNLLPNGTLEIGDVLHFEKDTGNEYDKYAIRVLKGEKFIGYIKKYHCKIFHEVGAEKLKLSVKAIEQNGFIKRVFVRVAY